MQQSQTNNEVNAIDVLAKKIAKKKFLSLYGMSREKALQLGIPVTSWIDQENQEAHLDECVEQFMKGIDVWENVDVSKVF